MLPRDLNPNPSIPPTSHCPSSTPTSTTWTGVALWVEDGLEVPAMIPAMEQSTVASQWPRSAVTEELHHGLQWDTCYRASSTWQYLDVGRHPGARP